MKTFFFGIALLGAISPLVPAANRARIRPLEGIVQPSRVVHIGGASDGLLAEVLAEEGDIVELDEVVAHLDFGVQRAQANLALARTELDAARQSAQARLELTADRLRRREALLEEGIVTSDEVQALRAEHKLAELLLLEVAEGQRIAQLEYERSKAVLEQALITSPIRGVVTERLLSAGELLSSSEAREIMTIAQLDPLLIDINAPLELLGSIAVGDEALVELINVDYARSPARVQVVERLVDTASETFRVRLEFPNPQLELPGGLRCRVAFKP